MVVVKQAWKVNAEPLGQGAELIANFQTRAFSLFEQEAAEVAPDLLTDLQFYPAPPPNSTYERTYKLRDGWQMFIGQVSGSLFKFEVSNSVGYTQWVVGSLAQARSAAARFQRDFHRSNGWELATDKVTFWFQKLKASYQARIEEELTRDGIFTLKRRARTRLR